MVAAGGSTALAGARVLVTRPAAQSEPLCRQIRAAGGSAWCLPLQRIVPAASEAELRAALAAASDAQWWLFTSANAARQALALQPPPWQPAVATVGAATAATLEQGGVTPVLYPAQAHSAQALLALPALAAVDGQRCVVLTGHDGRPELAEGLRARGARVESLALYRREPEVHAPEAVAAAIAGCDVVVFTSGEGVERLCALAAPAARAMLQRKASLAPSARVAEKMRELGFLAPPLLPEPMSDAAIVRALADWWTAQGNAP